MQSENEPHEERQADEQPRDSDYAWALPLDDPDTTWALVERMGR